jgi:uncharacterized delta-60 repeat protein
LVFVRYTADGHLDATFGTNGITTTNLNTFGSGELQALAIQPDGKLIGAGFHSTSVVLVRYSTNGQPDSSFGNNGAVLTMVNPNSSKAFAVAIQADGKIVVAGEVLARKGTPVTPRVDVDFAISRYNADGSLDPAFGDGGHITTGFSKNSVDEAQAVAIQPDGKIVAAGSTEKNWRLNFAVARYEA